uniref:Putative head-tail joining protein n=1 Tax=viral metagenome TaxID=1070528 RepID=A0A6M3JUE2_9ZZZZ
MNTGKLNKRITIQAFTATQDEYGGQVQTWTDVCGKWARVEPLNGREYFASQLLVNKIDTRFTIRYREGLKTNMRVVYNSEDYNIQSIINMEEKNREMQLMCMRITT